MPPALQYRKLGPYAPKRLKPQEDESPLTPKRCRRALRTRGSHWWALGEPGEDKLEVAGDRVEVGPGLVGLMRRQVDVIGHGTRFIGRWLRDRYERPMGTDQEPLCLDCD